jgi:mitochondrial fission protein ELM1
MTQEDIIRMAREAGLVGGPVYAKGLEAFAALVAKKYIEKIKDLEDFITELQERT